MDMNNLMDNMNQMNNLATELNEMEKINLFVNSKEYENRPDKDIIKYENIQLEDSNENKGINNNKNGENCNVCYII